jgi:hypothetical protein
VALNLTHSSFEEILILKSKSRKGRVLPVGD